MLPALLKADALAGLFVREAEKQGLRLQGMTMEEAIDAVFVKGFPDCASGTSG